MINSKNNTQKKDKKWIKKFINIPIIQVSFLHILKISATKSIKISVRTIAKITEECRNAKCVKLPDNMYKMMACETIQNFSKFLRNSFKMVCLDVRYWKI